ncbi:MAG: response regulator [Lentilitoribacter sp.]
MKTVLLIDDDEMDHFFFKRLVSKSPVIEDVICFQYADEALDFLAKDNRPAISVIFLDINMPRMNGFEFLEEAQRLLPDSFEQKAVVVMVTSSLAPEDQEQAAKFDVIKAYLNKPLDAETLAKVVEDASS